MTDYSSLMFDYASTGRPMLFFTYDLEHYRDELRGFYFDFEHEAPGPLLGTSDEVIEALRSIDDVGRAYAAPTSSSPAASANWTTARPRAGSSTASSDPADGASGMTQSDVRTDAPKTVRRSVRHPAVLALLTWLPRPRWRCCSPPSPTAAPSAPKARYSRSAPRPAPRRRTRARGGLPRRWHTDALGCGRLPPGSLGGARPAQQPARHPFGFAGLLGDEGRRRDGHPLQRHRVPVGRHRRRSPHRIPAAVPVGGRPRLRPPGRGRLAGARRRADPHHLRRRPADVHAVDPPGPGARRAGRGRRPAQGTRGRRAGRVHPMGSGDVRPSA